MGNSEKESLGKPLTLEIIVRREAQIEVREAFDYYETKNIGLGFEFMRSLDAVLQSVKRNPLAYQTIYKETRRVLLRKFPYAIFYVAEENRVVVIACFHQKRSPIDWLSRS
jgi:plasmid stabilization system protein ParE